MIENGRNWNYFEETDKFVNDNPYDDMQLKELVEAAEKEGVIPATPDGTEPPNADKSAP